MNSKKHPLDNYKKFLLNRSAANTTFVEFIENLIVAEDITANYTFHKIMVHSWNSSNEALFDTLMEYFSAWFIPVDVTTQRNITSFYTSSLNFILRLTRLDFMFPFEHNMFNIDVLFNDKSSLDLFGHDIAIHDIISSVVSKRFDENKMLDLSNFCNEQEFKEKKICFYKLSLLAHYKILMLRMGRDTVSLNLSHNELVQPPVDVMNFFIKGDLTEINLSYNKINTITDLLRVTSKIEKLWVEGNPLCEDVEPSTYVKNIRMRFPRLVELDGIKLNEFGVGFPFRRNFMINPSKQLKMLVEKFLTVYFSQFDTHPRRWNIDGFYDDHCCLTVTTGFTESEKLSISSPAILDLACNPTGTSKNGLLNNKVFRNKNAVLSMLDSLPASQHDPTTFTVDLLTYEKQSMVLVVDGIFKDVENKFATNVLRFRRTFVFAVYKPNNYNTIYKIRNEMMYIAFPSEQQLQNCFKFPIRNMNTFELLNPGPEEVETLVKIFSQIAHLKKKECEKRLSLTNWDLKAAIAGFVADMNTQKVDDSLFIEEDAFSDTSSIIDDEMVD